MNNNYKAAVIGQENVTMEITEKVWDGAVVLGVRAQQETKNPLFGRQVYFKPAKSVSYEIAGLKAEEFMAVYQHKDWWVRPAFGTSLCDVPQRSQLLLLHQKEAYTAVLAVCAEECRSDIRGSEGGIAVDVSTNKTGIRRIEDISVVLVRDTDPYKACERAAKAALKAMGREYMHRSCRSYPALFEYFGWCSWDAFYHDVNGEGICAKLDELKEKQIPVKWVLIDDGWLDADYEAQELKGLDGDRTKFPDGLNSFTRHIKEKYDIRHVGVWHAIMGYWNGLKKESSAARQLAEGSALLPDGRLAPKAKAEDAFSFYDKWHSYLKGQCGIDFIKVDGQSAVSLFYEGMESYGHASREIQKGLGASAALHFNNWMINCMGMASEDMWNRISSPVSRSSDDFVPNIPHGFREHAIQNSYNSLLQGQFFYNDWDMFWSVHEENLQNSMLRAVSGGPVYISDGLGNTEPSCILPLILEDGRVPRCQDLGVPTVDCLFTNPADSREPLKIFNRYEDFYIITAFHINQQDKPCRGAIHISDIPGLLGNDWYVFCFREKTVQVLTKENPVVFDLEKMEGELFVLMKKKEGPQVLGLVDKYISPAGVWGCMEQQNRLAVILKQGGTLGIVSAQKPEKALWEGRELAITAREGGLSLIEVPGSGRQLVEIIYYM